MSKRAWILAGLAVTAVGVTAIGAKAYRGSYHGGGYHGGEGHHFGGGYDGERRGWRRGWRGKITKEEFDRRTRSRFAGWDTNSDGVVDASEAETWISRRMERRHRRWRGERRLQRAMRRFDLNNDGKISKAEMSQRVGEIFARIDLDSDGRITDADLPPMMRDRDILSRDHGPGFGRRHHRRRGMRMLRHLRGADANNDGTITREEMQAKADKRFARFDRNKDGVVDRADISAIQNEAVDYRVRRFLHRFGASQDGKLTIEQFTKHRDERFARRDRDGDGVLSRDERGGRHWRKSWRHHEERGPGGRRHERMERDRPGQGGPEDGARRL